MSAAKNFSVELRVGHDLQRRVQAHGLVVAHQNGRRATALGDGDALVSAGDLIDERAELRFSLRERKRFHDVTRLLTNPRLGNMSALAVARAQYKKTAQGSGSVARLK